MYRDYGRNWRRNSGVRDLRGFRSVSPRRDDFKRDLHQQQSNRNGPIDNYSGTPLVNRNYQSSFLQNLPEEQQHRRVQNSFFTPTSNFNAPTVQLMHPFSSINLQNQSVSNNQNQNQNQTPMPKFSTFRNGSNDQFMR